MSQDLMNRLRAAGDLLDEHGAQRVDDAVDGEGRILNISSIAAARRQRGQRVLAAAAVVLVTGLVAAVALNARIEGSGVATGGGLVALVPSDGIGEWATLQVSEEEFVPMTGYEAVVVVPANSVGTDRMASAASIAVVPEGSVESIPGTDDEVLRGSGLEGHLNREAGPRSILATLPLEGPDGPVHIVVSAREDIPVDEMFELAALVDPRLPVEDQTLDGWDVMAGTSSLVGTVHRTVHLLDAEPPNQVERWMSITTTTGADDSALWLAQEPFTADVTEVRGKEAWVWLEGSMTTVTWIESPGALVGVRYFSSAEGEDRVASALAAAEDLVPADQDAWDQFVEQATESPAVTPTPEERWEARAPADSEFCRLAYPDFSDEAGVEESYIGSPEHVAWFDELLAVAPDEIVDDLRAVRNYFDEFVDPADPDSNLIENFPSEIQEQSRRIEELIGNRCQPPESSD